MNIRETCPKCGSDQLVIEFRDWFGDDDLPPVGSYGVYLECTKCGHSWPEKGSPYD